MEKLTSELRRFLTGRTIEQYDDFLRRKERMTVASVTYDGSKYITLRGEGDCQNAYIPTYKVEMFMELGRCSYPRKMEFRTYNVTLTICSEEEQY